MKLHDNNFPYCSYYRNGDKELDIDVMGIEDVKSITINSGKVGINFSFGEHKDLSITMSEKVFAKIGDLLMEAHNE